MTTFDLLVPYLNILYVVLLCASILGLVANLFAYRKHGDAYDLFVAGALGLLSGLIVGFLYLINS